MPSAPMWDMDVMAMGGSGGGGGKPSAAGKGVACRVEALPAGRAKRCNVALKFNAANTPRGCSAWGVERAWYTLRYALGH